MSRADAVGRHLKKYSKNASAQLATITSQSGLSLNLRCPYYARVMKMFEMKSSKAVIMIVQLASTNLLKLCRYLSIRFEMAPPKLEVSFRVTQVLWSESDTNETTPAAR